MKIHKFFNHLCLRVTISSRISKIPILKKEGIIKKIPMSVATRSRQTKRAYIIIRLCPERRRKKNPGSKGLLRYQGQDPHLRSGRWND